MRYFMIRDAAAEMGISVAVLRVWEVRYSWPPCVRKTNGFRLYSDVTIKEVREFNAAGRPFRQIKCGFWDRAGDTPVEKPRPLITPCDDLERRWIDALQDLNFPRVAEYLSAKERMRPAVRAQYVRSVQEANRVTGGAFAHLLKRYQIEQHQSGGGDG